MNAKFNKSAPVFQKPVEGKYRQSEQGFSTKENTKEKTTLRRKKPSSEASTANYQWSDTQIVAKKAGRKDISSGSVQVLIKSDKNQKKEGALSPRAPEKIKNNRQEEMKVFGESACLSVFKQRPEGIVRLWATVEMSHRIPELLSYLAQAKKAYHIVDKMELNTICGSEHHGGICLLIKKPNLHPLARYLQSSKRQDCVLLLADVNNSHNIGGVIRSAAYYGVKGIVCNTPEKLFSSATARVAEGGLEYVNCLSSQDVSTALALFKQHNYQIISLTLNKQATSLAQLTLQDKVVFVLQEKLLDDELDVDHRVVLGFEDPIGVGMNIAVNTGILLSRWYFR